jgi:hypothetical protein
LPEQRVAAKHGEREQAEEFPADLCEGRLSFVEAIAIERGETSLTRARRG